jgi:putative nucleotidyltransferase-like protein
MTALPISEREELLLKAALHRDPELAAASWEAWTARIALEDVPRPELRLLTAVHANLTRIAPGLCLPPKLRGKAKANFTRTNLLARATLPALEELGRHSPVMLTKGMAICIRFGAWSSRSLFDVDFHVPSDALDKAYQVLVEDGWTPAFGLTRLSLLHRSRMRRDSWNFYKERAELDLHWRLGGTPFEDWLAKEMWATGEEVEFNGRRLVLQSPEFALLSSLQHGLWELMPIGCKPSWTRRRCCHSVRRRGCFSCSERRICSTRSTIFFRFSKRLVSPTSCRPR